MALEETTELLDVEVIGNIAEMISDESVSDTEIVAEIYKVKNAVEKNRFLQMLKKERGKTTGITIGAARDMMKAITLEEARERYEVMKNDDDRFSPYDNVYFNTVTGEYIFIKDTTILIHAAARAKEILSDDVLSTAHRLKSIYAPNKPIGAAFYDADGLESWNTFTPSEYVKEAEVSEGLEVPENIEILIRHLIGECDEMYEVFINALAYHLQTGEAIHLGWIFSGIEGSGKGTLMDKVIAPLFGEHNVSSQSLNAFTGDKIAGCPDTLISHCDETVRDKKTSREVVNNMKKIIGNENYASRQLYYDEKGVRNWTMFFFTVNSFDFVLTTEDRRFNIVYTPKKLTDIIKDTAKFRKDITRELEDFANFLMSHKVDNALTRKIVDSDFRTEAILGNLSYEAKIATCILTGKLDVFEDRFDRENKYNEKGIDAMEDQLKQIHSHQFVKGSLVSDLIDDIYNNINYPPDWDKHPMDVRKRIKEKWLYTKKKINKKVVWNYEVACCNNDKKLLNFNEFKDEVKKVAKGGKK